VKVEFGKPGEFLHGENLILTKVSLTYLKYHWYHKDFKTP
jgi:hypothetical protein